MAIVTMKKLSLWAMAEDRDRLLRRLQRLGCVDLSQPQAPEEYQALAHPDTPEAGDLARHRQLLTQALERLGQYADVKTSFLTPRPQVELDALFDDETAAQALTAAQAIQADGAALDALDAAIAQASAQQAGYAPWTGLEVPLNYTGTAHVAARYLTLPSTVELDAVRQALSETGDAWELYQASSDASLHYLFLLCHGEMLEPALAALKPFGLSQVSFKGAEGTAAEATAALDRQLKTLRQDRAAAEGRITAQKDQLSAMQLYAERLEQELAVQQARGALLNTRYTFSLEGWLPAEDCPRLEKLLENYDCAWELRDPTEKEYPQVPVKLKNNVLTRGMNVVTEMYSLPRYGTVDPNPLMAPFFIAFFGLMMADMAYGLIMIAAGLFVLKKAKPKESTRNFMELVVLCGISTFVVGALTGGFLGDFIPQLCKLIDPESTFALPALFTPLNDTMAIMIGSLILGVIQIFTGMAVSVVAKCRAGNFIDALFSEITWWIILAGIALMVLGIGSVHGWPVVLIVGCLMLVFGGTREAKGFGKVTSLVGLVYNGVTGYFSDILSYVRLMALMLSGSVIAQVFNTLGSVFGSVVLFIIISLVGNALNLALNLLGCYVHDLRLQCLEFFNRFYSEGGVAYEPLSIQTNRVEIIKEEQ